MPTCTIANPIFGDNITLGDLVIISVNADDSDGDIKEVQLFIDNSLVFSTSSIPYSYQWNTNMMDIGKHIIIAVAIDNNGISATDVIIIYLIGAKGTLTDIDGNIYSTIQIGTQWWMSENLDVSHYNDGTAIPLVNDPHKWVDLTTPGYCYYGNTFQDTITYKAIYGALYNWYVVNTGNLCPTGWHVPSDAEWTNLSTFLGGEAIAGGKLKERGTTYWRYPNRGATNESGFTGLPGGNRIYYGAFSQIELNGFWWSSTESDSTNAYYRSLDYFSTKLYRYILMKRDACSVRCLKD